MLANKPLVENDRVSFGKEGGNIFTLKINPVELGDKGRLKCTAKNSQGEASCFGDLGIRPGPPKVEMLCDAEVYTGVGEDVTLQVK